jgi:cell pole-organizing protein PopZ
MEEILASIRRIISDEEPKAAAAARPAAVKPAPAAPAPRPVVSAPPVRAPEAPAPQTPVPEARAPESEARPSPSPAPAVPPAAIEPVSATDDILDLTEQMAQPEAPAPEFRTIDGTQDIVFAESDLRATAYEPASEPRPAIVAQEPDYGSESAHDFPEPLALGNSLLSQPSAAAVDSAFNTLAHTVLVQNARTLEDLVKEMLRPMLKSWLDDNLPGLVERLVRAEIERVSRGRTS